MRDALPQEYAGLIHNLRAIQPGERIVYYNGFLDYERMNDPLGPHSIVAGVAYSLMQEGRLHLTQHRLSPPTGKDGAVNWKVGQGAGFKYIATGALPKKKIRTEFLHPMILSGNRTLASLLSSNQ